MKIYTKAGDRGETGLYGGPRVPKDDRRIQAYGTLDELNASLGVVIADSALPGDLKADLLRIQGELFQLGAELATPSGKSSGVTLIGATEAEALETQIDAWETSLTPLKTFILPGGSLLAAHLHMARTISRRAEREIVSLHRDQPLRDEVLIYVNRLSDYLFVAARYCNRSQGVADVPWSPRR